MANFHMVQGDTAIPLDFSVGQNVSDFTLFNIVIRSPKGIRKVLTVLALKPATNDTGRYTPVETDFDEGGVWLAQAYVEQPGGLKRKSKPIQTINVESAL